MNRSRNLSSRQDDSSVFTENLNNQLKDLQVRQALNKQKLLEIKKSNQNLVEDLNNLNSQIQKLQKAQDINQTFFQRNDKQLSVLKKQIDKQTFNFQSGLKTDLDTLLERTKQIQQDHRQSTNYYLNNTLQLPQFQDKLLQLQKGQILILFQQLVQKEQAHQNIHQRYYQNWATTCQDIESTVADIRRLTLERKQDLQTISVLERKKDMMEAGLYLEPETINAHQLAIKATNNVIDKIHSSDIDSLLEPLTKKLQRNLRNK